MEICTDCDRLLRSARYTTCDLFSFSSRRLRSIGVYGNTCEPKELKPSLVSIICSSISFGPLIMIQHLHSDHMHSLVANAFTRGLNELGIQSARSSSLCTSRVIVRQVVVLGQSRRALRHALMLTLSRFLSSHHSKSWKKHSLTCRGNMKSSVLSSARWARNSRSEEVRIVTVMSSGTVDATSSRKSLQQDRRGIVFEESYARTIRTSASACAHTCFRSSRGSTDIVPSGFDCGDTNSARWMQPVRVGSKRGDMIVGKILRLLSSRNCNKGEKVFKKMELRSVQDLNTLKHGTPTGGNMVPTTIGFARRIRQLRARCHPDHSLPLQSPNYEEAMDHENNTHSTETDIHHHAATLLSSEAMSQGIVSSSCNSMHL